MTMPTEHCPQCNPDNPCGNGHVYVVQLKSDSKISKGFLYVGKTGKSVEQRFDDNLTRKTGEIVSLNEAKRIGEDKMWKYNTGSAKLIRSSYKKHRPDLEYYKRNPIIRYDNDVRLNAAEVNLAEDLRKRGWTVRQA